MLRCGKSSINPRNAPLPGVGKPAKHRVGDGRIIAIKTRKRKLKPCGSRRKTHLNQVDPLRPSSGSEPLKSTTGAASYQSDLPRLTMAPPRPKPHFLQLRQRRVSGGGGKRQSGQFSRNRNGGRLTTNVPKILIWAYFRAVFYRYRTINPHTCTGKFILRTH